MSENKSNTKGFWTGLGWCLIWLGFGGCVYLAQKDGDKPVIEIRDSFNTTNQIVRAK